MTAGLFDAFPERRTDWPNANMLNRLSYPEEYRGAAVFLLSNASSFSELPFLPAFYDPFAPLCSLTEHLSDRCGLADRRRTLRMVNRDGTRAGTQTKDPWERGVLGGGVLIRDRESLCLGVSSRYAEDSLHGIVAWPILVHPEGREIQTIQSKSSRLSRKGCDQPERP